MSMNQTDIAAIERAVSKSLHQHWKLFLAEGLVLLVLGMAAVVIPVVATLAVAMLLGWLFLLSGMVGLVTTFWMRHAPGFWWSLLSALLGLAVGIVLLSWPEGGAFSLTVVLVVFFLMEGVATTMFALDHRRELSGRWGFMLASGVVDLILGGMIFLGLPASAAWAIGLLVGINMVMGGAALIAMALHARAANPTLTTSPP
jgi:uncharacterized membrane protein HdeD (DUF308 family)